MTTMGIIDDAKAKLQEAENKLHEEKGKVEGYAEAKNQQTDKKCNCGKDGCTCKR